MEQLARNHTFKCILATLLAMGNFLNGSQVRNGVLGDAAWVLCEQEQPWHVRAQDHEKFGRWCGCWCWSSWSTGGWQVGEAPLSIGVSEQRL